MRKLLVIGDSPTRSTGFAVVVENILLNLSPQDWDIHILGINYYGDYHEYQKKWKIYNPSVGGDVYGFARINEILDKVKPDIIWILNDVWLCSSYVQRIKKVMPNVPIVVYTPVDSPGIKPEFVTPLNWVSHVISYTHWGLDELRNSGLTTQASVAPHGINPGLFSPMSKTEARKQLFGGTKELADKGPFVVLYVSRNQPRKRVDLFVYIIAKWLQKYPHDDVYFHYHGAPKGDLGWNIEFLAEYYARKLNVPVDKRLILTAKNLSPENSIPVDKLKVIYNGADVYFHACAVEGWALTVAEAMACGVPTIVADYSALAEWPNGAVHYVPVDDTPWHNPNDIDTEHRFIDVNAAVEALEYLYNNKEYRAELAQKAAKHMLQKHFMWKNIAKHFDNVFKESLKRTETMKGIEDWKTLADQIKLDQRK